MAQILDDRLLLGLSDAIGRPLLGREIDLQVLMGENPTANARDVSGHGSDHCCNPISCRPCQLSHRSPLLLTAKNPGARAPGLEIKCCDLVVGRREVSASGRSLPS
jgi:hypothetical protein